MLFIAVFLGVGLTYAYFTATAKDKQEIHFANISVDFVDSNDVYTTNLFKGQSIGKLQPGQSVPINNVYVKNIGEYDIYAIYKLTLTITKYEATQAETFTYWYNLDGDPLTGDESSTTDKATYLAISNKIQTNLTLKISDALDNSYKKASANINLEVLAIQALIKENSNLDEAIQACQLLIKNQDTPDVEHTLYIRPNGGTYNDSTETLTVSQDRSSSLEIGTPTRTGYTFTGWTLTGDGSLNGSTYTFGKSVGSLTAQWQANTYTISLNYNNGFAHDISKWLKNTHVDSTMKFAYDSLTCMNTININTMGGWEIVGTPISVKENTNYTITFDYETPTYSTLSGYSNSVIQILTYSPVTADSECSSISIAQAELKSNAKETSTITFNSGSYTTLYFALNHGYMADDQTLTYKIGNFNIIQQSDIEYDAIYGTLPTPTREGCTFNGWYKGYETNATGDYWAWGKITKQIVQENFKPNTTYKLSYYLKLDEELPSGYSYSQTSQWGNIGYRVGSDGYAWDMFAQTRIHDLTGDNPVVGQYYYKEAEFTTPADISDMVFVFYTFRCEDSSGNGKVLSGTFKDMRFISKDDADKVTSSTVVTATANHTLFADWTRNETTSTTDITKENEQTSSQIENQTIVLPSKQKWVE